MIGEVTGDRPAGDDLARRAGGGHPAGRPPPTRARSTTGPPPRPASQDALAADDPAAPAAARRPARSCGRRCCPCSASPGLADKTWVTEQYDRYVRGNTVLAMPEDAGVIRVDEETGLGVALATDGNGRYCRLDPYAGTQLALAEAYRNVAATGARPLAVTNCLNFGSPEDPAVMWQFAEAVRGLADGCAAARHPGDRRQRQLLQPDRAGGHPPDPGGRRARRPRRRAAAAVAAASPAGGAGRAARHGPAPSSAGRPGRRWRTVTWAAARPRWTWRPNGPGACCSPRRPRPACWRRHTTCPTAGSPSRSPSPAWLAGRAAR